MREISRQQGTRDCSRETQTSTPPKLCTQESIQLNLSLPSTPLSFSLSLSFQSKTMQIHRGQYWQEQLTEWVNKKGSLWPDCPVSPRIWTLRPGEVRRHALPHTNQHYCEEKQEFLAPCQIKFSWSDTNYEGGFSIYSSITIYFFLEELIFLKVLSPGNSFLPSSFLLFTFFFPFLALWLLFSSTLSLSFIGMYACRYRR